MRKLILSILLSLLCSPSWATTVTFQDGVSGYDGERDAQLKSGSINEHMEGTQGRATGGIYTLTYFDISSASIPTTATVTSATLTINEVETDANGGNIGVYKVLDPDSTGSGTVYTWCGSACDDFNVHSSYRYKKEESTTIQWNNAADNVASANITSSVTNSSALALNFTGLINLTVTSTVQGWVTTPSSNLGFVLEVGNISDPGARWDSYLGTTKPSLSITYTTTASNTGFKRFLR